MTSHEITNEVSITMSTNILTKQGTQTRTEYKGKSTHKENQQSMTRKHLHKTNTETLTQTNIANKSIFSTLVNGSTAQTSYLTTRMLTLGGTHTTIKNKGSTRSVEKTKSSFTLKVSSSHSQPLKEISSITSTTSQIRITTFIDSVSEIPHKLTDSRTSTLQPTRYLESTNISTSYIDPSQISSVQSKTTNTTSPSQIPSTKTSLTQTQMTNKFSSELPTTDIFSSQSPPGKNQTLRLICTLYYVKKSHPHS